MIYLYNWAGEPQKTRKWVKEVMSRLYSSTPDGYCGDEDNGQTSAWYVFSALGFYPVCPGSGEYAVGAPLFKNALINLENGKKVRITAADSCGNDVLFLKHEDLIKGTRLQLKTK
jgi:putative alpha-1,2-mannosidase